MISPLLNKTSRFLLSSLYRTSCQSICFPVASDTSHTHKNLNFGFFLSLQSLLISQAPEIQILLLNDTFCCNICVTQLVPRRYLDDSAIGILMFLFYSNQALSICLKFRLYFYCVLATPGRHKTVTDDLRFSVPKSCTFLSHLFLFSGHLPKELQTSFIQRNHCQAYLFQ